jgi:hypothetical protein
MEFRTNTYPEWDLESCSNCRGTGISEVCADCQVRDEVEEYD